MSDSTSHDSVSTRARLREAAFALFAEKGYDGASMSQLAERVGLAKPSLYNYYRSKEELLLDLLEAGIRDWSADCMAPFARAGTFERQLADHLHRTVVFAREQPHLVAVFHLATLHVQGELALRVQEVVARSEAALRGQIRERLEQARAAGELDVESTDDAMAFLGVFFHGLLFLQANCHHDVGPIEERLDEIWRQLFRGLAGREPKERIVA
ncbi:MAG: TetR/AcrR family transcriptional regulator [Thermoanaerobaculia bacterium]|nr:TetR/AcrR family transcriptional regulator [Thermoanaerobaculia bacterium]